MEVRSPKSFDDLRTVDGTVFPTYREACSAMGLLQGDQDLDDCLNVAAVFNTATHMRDLFCLLIAHNAPDDPLGLLIVTSKNYPTTLPGAFVASTT